MVLRDEARKFADADTAVAELEREVNSVTPQMRELLHQLLEDRQTLIAKTLQKNEVYLHQLQQLDLLEHKLRAVVDEYDDFLQQHLWWLRGSDPVGIQDIRTLIENAWQWDLTSVWPLLHDTMFDNLFALL